MEYRILTSYRALDLTDEQGWFCGRLLADLGMDVIKIERPEGDPGRARGPFYGDTPDAGKSIWWSAFNRGKRSLTLDITKEEGKKVFEHLVRRCDVVLESFPPGYMTGLGLDYEHLATLNGGLIFTSITPFGQSGPYAEYRSCDLVTMGMTGWLYLTGDSDRPPVVVGFPQSYATAGADGAAGTLCALYHRLVSGMGQRVDVSAQAGLIQVAYEGVLAWDMNRVMVGRQGSVRLLLGGVRHRLLWECRDGYVVWYHVGGRAGVASTSALVEWMESEDASDPFLSSVDWAALDMNKADQEFFDRVERPVGTFFSRHTREELYRGALQRRIMLYPVTRMGDLPKDPQLISRGFWKRSGHTQSDRTRDQLGPFVQISGMPSLEESDGVGRGVGQDTDEVLGRDLGMAHADIATLRDARII